MIPNSSVLNGYLVPDGATSRQCSSCSPVCSATRGRQTGGVETVVVSPETFGTACPRADKQWHESQNLLWGGGGSLLVVAADRRGADGTNTRVQGCSREKQNNSGRAFTLTPESTTPESTLLAGAVWKLCRNQIRNKRFSALIKP